jgi:hypothetical protein
MVITCPKCEGGRISVRSVETDDAHEHVAVKCRKCGWTHTCVMYGAAYAPHDTSLAGYLHEAARSPSPFGLTDIVALI